MKMPRDTRLPILERRRVKRGAREAEVAQERAREMAAAKRELAKSHVLVNPQNLRPTNSHGRPDFVKRGHYVDMPFNCKSCGVPQVWTEFQQKWWYESAKGDVLDQGSTVSELSEARAGSPCGSPRSSSCRTRSKGQTCAVGSDSSVRRCGGQSSPLGAKS